MTSYRYERPDFEDEVPGETQREAWQRRARNQAARKRWSRYMAEKCARCGFARSNVVHETDRENAPEGLAYYADVPFCEFMESGVPV